MDVFETEEYLYYIYIIRYHRGSRISGIYRRHEISRESSSLAEMKRDFQ